MKVRPLETILRRIAVHETYIERMKQLNIPESAITLEREIVSELKKEYTTRLNKSLEFE